jgi:NAD(P)H-hydrate epimerase
LRSPFSDWIEAINQSGRPVIALDIPSGLDADTGSVLGAAIRAHDTIAFAATKVGFYRGDGPRLCGRIHCVDIGLPREIWERASQ